jgi:FtsP/CotA-like multicopper oxidase with cupredoxin domain
MEKMRHIIRGLLLLLCLGLAVPGMAKADGGVCPRYAVGSEIQPPPDLYSVNGVLRVALNYFTSMDDAGRTLFCFVTADGKESPTLHVNPGDRVVITLTNMLPPVTSGPAERDSNPTTVCGDPVMTLTSTNMHFHGTNTSPACHSDEVIRTLVNSGETFEYKLKIPKDEPPGLYWYHPHIHGISSMAVEGGATGLIEVEGIANVQPAVAGLPERYIALRDQTVAAGADHGASGSSAPNWDVSVNYVPVNFPLYQPAVIKMQKGTQEFWRVANTAANTIMDLQLQYDGVAQPLQIVAFDGVPTGSKDGRRQGSIVTQKDILLAPAARAEFIVSAPPDGVKEAKLVTLGIDGGEAADNNPYRRLALIQTTDAPVKLSKAAEPSGPAPVMRFGDLANAPVTAQRLLYFSEYFQESHQPPRGAHPPDFDHVDFFITVEGQKETLYDPNNPPAIVTNQGAVEEWTIENRTQEVHEFHMHQIHFLVEAINGVPIPKKKQQLYDTFQVPYWDGISETYPSITVKMDFRGPTIGSFVYHCHILEHEDAGMMAIIQVLPKGAGAAGKPAQSASTDAGSASRASAAPVLQRATFLEPW